MSQQFDKEVSFKYLRYLRLLYAYNRSTMSRNYFIAILFFISNSADDFFVVVATYKSIVSIIDWYSNFDFKSKVTFVIWAIAWKALSKKRLVKLEIF